MAYSYLAGLLAQNPGEVFQWMVYNSTPDHKEMLLGQVRMGEGNPEGDRRLDEVGKVWCPLLLHMMPAGGLSIPLGATNCYTNAVWKTKARHEELQGVENRPNPRLFPLHCRFKMVQAPLP